MVLPSRFGKTILHPQRFFQSRSKRKSTAMSTRKTISRLVTLGGLCTAVALAATGCGAGGPAPTSGSASSTVNVLVEAGGHAELTGVAEQCKKDTGLNVNFVELPYDGMFNRLSSEFSSGNVSFDVAALDSVWLPSFKDAVQPIDELFTDEAKKDIFPALVKEANVDGHFIGMPAWTNAEIILYRKDLFEDAKNKADFKAKYGYELAAPTTWKQYQEAAKKAGVTVEAFYWTLGKYDMISILEAPSAEAVTALGLSIGKLGNVRTETLPAFDRTAMEEMLKKVV